MEEIHTAAAEASWNNCRYAMIFFDFEKLKTEISRHILKEL